MTTYLTDLVEYIFEQEQVSFDSIDTAELDALIQDYLETIENTYMEEESIQWVDDATSYLTYVIDTTAPITTVEAWKEENLENTYNQAHIQNKQIAITDHNSPNYPLIDFREVLFDFDVTTSIDYAITPDTTGDNYIQFEYPTAEKVDGMYIQPGINGIQSYDSTSESVDYSIIAFYIGYSNDGSRWRYFRSKDTLIVGTEPNVFSGYSTYSQTTARNNPFYISSSDLELSELGQERFVEFKISSLLKDYFGATEAKYWRVYFVDLLPGLESSGFDVDYTGYTASVSHLRFQQYREHGEVVVPQSIERAKTTGIYASGVQGSVNTAGGAGWFTTVTITTVNTGVREIATNINVRVASDSTCDFRIQFQEYDGGAWTTVDHYEFDDIGVVSLHDAREAVNPNEDVEDTWNVRYRLQDRAAAGAPVIKYRYAHNAIFRSSEVT